MVNFLPKKNNKNKWKNEKYNVVRGELDLVCIITRLQNRQREEKGCHTDSRVMHCIIVESKQRTANQGVWKLINGELFTNN